IVAKQKLNQIFTVEIVIDTTEIIVIPSYILRPTIVLILWIATSHIDLVYSSTHIISSISLNPRMNIFLLFGSKHSTYVMVAKSLRIVDPKIVQCCRPFAISIP